MDAFCCCCYRPWYAIVAQVTRYVKVPPEDAKAKVSLSLVPAAWAYHSPQAQVRTYPVKPSGEVDNASCEHSFTDAVPLAVTQGNVGRLQGKHIYEFLHTAACWVSAAAQKIRGGLQEQYPPKMYNNRRNGKVNVRVNRPLVSGCLCMIGGSLTRSRASRTCLLYFEENFNLWW